MVMAITDSTATATATHAAPSSRAQARLRRLQGSAGLAAVVLGVAGAIHRDGESVALAAVLGVGLGLLRSRHGLLARVVVMAVLLDTAAWMSPAALHNIANRVAPADVALPALLTLASLVGVISAATLGRRAHSTTSRHLRLDTRALAAPAICIAVALGLALPSAIAPARSARRQPGDLVLHVRSTAFSRRLLEAHRGLVGIYVHNHDLFWHTLTIKGTGVDLTLPVGAIRRVAFTAGPGRYRFYCRIPGHASAGMSGTLIIS